MVKGDISSEEEVDELIKMFEEPHNQTISKSINIWKPLRLGITTLDLPFLTCSLRKEITILKLRTPVVLSMDGTWMV